MTRQYGAEISRTTLGNWIIDCAEKYFLPQYEYFHKELLKRRFAMADETRIQVLKEPGRRPQTSFFMWLFRSDEEGEPQIVLYRYTETRAGHNAKEFLEGFSGYLMTDGYSGYNDWLFSDTPDGATVSAVIYTIVEMVKTHNLNVYRYLCYLLTKRPDKRWSDARLSKMAPWDYDVMDVCRNDDPKIK